MIEGTHTPTKIPACLSAVPRNPNHRLMESANDRNAAPKINASDSLNITIHAPIQVPRYNKASDAAEMTE